VSSYQQGRVDSDKGSGKKDRPDDQDATSMHDIDAGNKDNRGNSKGAMGIEVV